MYMIGYLKGKIIAKQGSSLTLDVRDVGYRVTVPAALALAAHEGGEVALHVHTYVREDQLSLYGFIDPDELQLFELLISVSGIGPKMAIAILSASTVQHIRSAIAAGESVLFTKISGVGRKTAERLIVELREKIGALGHDASGTAFSKDFSESLDALVGLGYSQQEAREALKQVPKDTADLSAVVRAALKILGGR